MFRTRSRKRSNDVEADGRTRGLNQILIIFTRRG